MRNLLIYLLFLTSGTTGLVYEVIWMRSLRLVLGSSVEAASTVLATFLGGLALGSFLGAQLSRSGNSLRRYAIAEVVVAATALTVPLWLMAYQAFYPTLYAWCGGDPIALRFCRLLMSLLAMGPTTIAMGTTLPLITREVVTNMDRFAWHTGILYAINTLGAMTGAFVAGFFLPLWVGVQGSTLLAAAVNIVVGIAAWILSGQSAGVAAKPVNRLTPEAAASAAPRAGVSLGLLILAALSGFGSLTLEVVYFRILSYHSEGSVYSFSLMLVFMLAFLALAAVWVARNLDQQDAWRFLAWTQLAAVAVLLVTPLVFQALPFLAGYDPEDQFGERMLRYAITSVIILGPSMLLIGVVLPCTWKIASTDLAQTGKVVGLLTGVNTLSAVVGSLIAGFIFLPRLGLGRTSLLVACVYGGIAILSLVRGYRGVRRWLGCAACLAIIVVWFLLGGWSLQLLGIEKGLKLVSYHDGPDATVTVFERKDGHRVLKVNHDYILGSSAGADREVRQGRLPLLLHPHPERVAFVGVATGMTVSGALDFPVQRVAAVELLPGVADTLPLFAKWNQSVGDDPRVEIVVEDGRNFLAGTDELFDVIISDLFVPWHAGTGDLYSVQHFQTAKARLAPGGIFSQCLPGYQLSIEELRTVTASFLKVFPNSVLWRNDYNINHPILCLSGYKDQLALDAESVRKHAQNLKESPAISAKFLDDPTGLPLLFVCGPQELAEWCDGASLNTDDYPIIEFSTPRSFFQHRQKTQIHALNDVLSHLRSSTWPFDEVPCDRSVEQVFKIADLVIEAQLAYTEHNFEREFQRVNQLAQMAGDLPSVAVYVMAVANRYHSRKMSDRGTQLLEKLAAFPEPPVRVLVALAREDRVSGNNQRAIELLQQAILKSPNMLGPRKILVEMLEEENDYRSAEPHLRKLVESRPLDPFLKVDLVKNLHHQERTGEAEKAIDEFFRSWDGSKRKEVWRYLRTSGLGQYVDRLSPDSEPAGKESPAKDRPAAVPQENQKP
ncbi:MAG: fused MFS/spermidine synthase [Pirellulales bacterium]|nr:fused MFS/spermidine synthase [Pirellulales bacterium]